MKLFAFSCVLYLSIFATVFGQVKISASDRDDLKNIIYSFNQLDQKSEILKQYPINKIGDDFYLSFLGKINNDFSKGYFQNKSIIVGKPISSIVSVKIKLKLSLYT